MREGFFSGAGLGVVPVSADLLATPILVALLVALAWIDLRERRLPDRLTLPLGALGLGLATFRQEGLPVAEVVGAAVGLGVFWALGEAHHRLRGIEGLGLGDAKLVGAAGAWLGWRGLAPLILLAALGALAWVALTSLWARGSATVAEGPLSRPGEVAFGPWLAAAFLGLWLLRVSAPGG